MEMNWLTPEVMWFLIGLVLLLAELALPSFILIFFGIGAWTTTFTTWITGIGTEAQIAVFLIASLVSLFTFRKKFLLSFEKAKPDTRFEDVESDFIGKTAITTETVDNVTGHVMFNGTSWKAISEELIEKDQNVEIVSKENITLKIKRI
jgi:membrane protein implicated in regulation of membrane protease activity